MVRVILTPYSSFRTEGFTAIVMEMGIKEFGEDAIPKAYIDFDDGGAPITYLLDIRGKPMIEDPIDGYARVRNFAVGAFAEQAKKLGYETYIDTDPGNYEFGTTPDLTGCVTTWEGKRSGKRIDADGTEREGFMNFTLVAIDSKKTPPLPTPLIDKKPAKAPAKTISSPAMVVKDIIESWKEVLIDVLTVPLNEAGILKAVNAKYPDDGKRKALHQVRKATLQELVKTNFLTIDAAGKYEISQ